MYAYEINENGDITQGYIGDNPPSGWFTSEEPIVARDHKIINGVVTEIIEEIITPEPYVPTLEEVRQQKLNALYYSFVQARDAITWVETTEYKYGYDRNTDDIVNFMAARERAKISEPIPYKIYKQDGTKALIDHTLSMFDLCLNQSATEQLAAYAWYEQIKNSIVNAANTTELNNITW